MNQEAYREVTKMINGFPRSAADLRALLLTYDEDTTGIPDAAVIEAAQRFRRCEVKGQNVDFAPSIAKFCGEARRIAEVMHYRNRPALPVPVSMPTYYPGKLAPFQVRAQQLREKYADRPVLAEGLSHDQWLTKARAGEFPPGHTWIGGLNGTVFGSVPQHIEQEDAA